MKCDSGVQSQSNSGLVQGWNLLPLVCGEGLLWLRVLQNERKLWLGMTPQLWDFGGCGRLGLRAALATRPKSNENQRRVMSSKGNAMKKQGKVIHVCHWCDSHRAVSSPVRACLVICMFRRLLIIHIMSRKINIMSNPHFIMSRGIPLCTRALSSYS